MRISLRQREKGAWIAALVMVAFLALWVAYIASEWPRLSAVFASGGNSLALDY
jgi:hypothetical protein